ncbi:hypothetical protein EMN47_01805 [Prolixibacteraceae bacterium JC049]|nr:hypothetical protein [Prolixibacteraceae bacterium JC049]
MKRLLLVLLIIICTSAIHAQNNNRTQKYISDFNFLITKLIETHPDPYSGFCDSIGFHSAKKECIASISKAYSNKEFVFIVNKFLSNLKDGHTYLQFQRSNNRNQYHFPLKFKASSNHIYIQNSNKEYQHLQGMVLLKVNKLPIKRLLEKASHFQPAENYSGQQYNLIKILHSDHLSQLFFEKSDTLTLTLRNQTGDFRNYKIPFLPKCKYLTQKSRIHTHNSNGLLDWSMIGKNGDIGYFRWNSILSREVVQNTYKSSPSWINGNINWAFSFLHEKRSTSIEENILKIPSLYEQFYLLAKALKKRKSQHLIIDLRYNNGGMTPIVEPLLYILYGDRYLSFDFNAQMIRRISPLALNKMGYKSILEFNKKYGCNLKLGDFTFSQFGNFHHQKSLEKRRSIALNGYNGFGAKNLQKTPLLTSIKITVITSPETFSAAYHFTYFLKKLGRTQIIGTPSRQAANTFMETTQIVLPNTQLTGSISNSKQILFKDTSIPQKDLKPDYNMSWEDFKLLNFDSNAEILKALKIIESH